MPGSQKQLPTGSHAHDNSIGIYGNSLSLLLCLLIYVHMYTYTHSHTHEFLMKTFSCWVSVLSNSEAVKNLGQMEAKTEYLHRQLI